MIKPNKYIRDAIVYGTQKLTMLRTAVLLCFVGLAVANPAVIRSREEIEAFRHFLESTQTSKSILQL